MFEDHRFTSGVTETVTDQLRILLRARKPWIESATARSPAALRDALRITSNPRPADRQTQRLLAWSILKSARGQTISQSRLARLHPHDGPGPRGAD